MRLFAIIALAICAPFLGQLDASAAPPVKPTEAKIDALTDAVCVQAVLFDDKNGRRGRTTPKVCREAPHTVFVSSTTFAAPKVRGDADAKCELLAADAGLTIAQQIDSTIDYDLDEWIDHGAPEETARREITERMESHLECDRSGLKVRLESGVLRFTHKVGVFVLARS